MHNFQSLNLSLCTGQYDGNQSYTSVAQKCAYGYARGQYSTALLGTSV